MKTLLCILALLVTAHLINSLVVRRNNVIQSSKESWVMAKSKELLEDYKKEKGLYPDDLLKLNWGNFGDGATLETVNLLQKRYKSNGVSYRFEE